jgi:hypothetical protein
MQDDQVVLPASLVVVGELTGPGLDGPVQLTTAPGRKFQIPGLPKVGEYYLQNVRLMNGTEFLQYATPSAVKITVADLLQTNITVKQLSPQDLRDRGIVIDARNFDVYEFSFTFIVDGKPVEIPFPVIVDRRTHEVQPVMTESPYVMPKPTLVEPPRWTPPQVIPIDFGEDDVAEEDPGKDPVEKTPQAGRPSIPAAIVIPNGLAVLHQFFAVTMMVTNGAPHGSSARVEDIRATIRIPTALRTVKTVPEVSFGMPVPVIEPNTKATFLVAQARGEAEWTLEGLTPGTHRIDFDLRATLRQDGQEDIPLRTTPSASIVIHDPRFNITFSHPEVVRQGLEYTTHAFITNMSATDQSITLANTIPACAGTNLTTNELPPPGADPNVCRLTGNVTDLITIPAGDMRMIEYRLRANVTGQVYATAGTLSNTDVLSAKVNLTMGVSESGIPLSPATLLMPYYAQFVSPDLVGANLQLLGLGYSLATSPVNQMTAKFPRVIKTDVFARAVDIARAGQRIFIAKDQPEAKRDAISHLTLDLLGNAGFALREWDELRRREKSGRSAGAAVIAELNASAFTTGATMTSVVDAFASATAHRDAYVAALVHGSASGERPYALALAGTTSKLRTELPNEAADGWVRGIPFADISRFNGAGEQGELALVGRWTEELDLEVTPAANGLFELEVLYPDTTTGHLLRAHFNLSGASGQTMVIHIARGATSLDARDANGAILGVATISTVNAAPLRLVAARQDLHLDIDGHKVAMLFNRPVETPSGVDLRDRFTGAIDFNRDGVIYKGARPISAAAMQEDGRVIVTTFDHTLSKNATYTVSAGSLLDPISRALVSFPDKVVPTIDNDLPAGVIYGKVLKGDGTPIAGVDVTIRQYLPNLLQAYPKGKPQFDVSQSDGAFLFEFVRRQIDADWTGAYRLEAASSIHGGTALEGIVRQPGHVHFVNLQYLGRGAAEGYVRYNDGSVVANADVLVGSTMFDIAKTARTDAKGFYHVDDLPVGPLTFSVQDEAGNAAFAANEVSIPNEVVKQNLSIFRQPFPGLARVFGVVRRADTNAPVAGARVGVFSQGYGLRDGYTDSQGRFDFTRVPAGFVTVLAQEWGVAPQPAAIDFDLKADEVKEVNVLLFPVAAQGTATLTGTVVREKLLQPGVYEPAGNAVVKINGYRTVTADAQGNFKYEELPLSFSAKSITAYDPLTKRVNSAQVPTLTVAGPNSVSIFINASDRGSGSIRVRLLSAAGVPVPGYRVIEPGFPPVKLADKGNGIYELPDVGVGGAVHICAVRVANRTAEGKLQPGDKFGDQMVCGSMGVSFNGQIAALTLRLPGQGKVRVKVKSQFDLITDVTLSYPVWYEGEQHALPETIRASTKQGIEAGYAEFEGIPALTSYTVASAHTQYGAASKSGTLAYDGEIFEHVLQLNTLAAVRGTVYAIDGVTPVAGAIVRINNGRSDPGPQVTGPDGRFEFFDQPSDTRVEVTAQVTQSDIYRIGIASAVTPESGGSVENMSVILRKRGFVEGRVVYKDYKKYDPNNAANNILDDTPSDPSDNAPVPLAKFHLRELDYPNRTFGTRSTPLNADTSGRFYLSNLFVGGLRATAWDSGNEELRGDWSGSIDEEGAEATPRAYIAIGGGGTGNAEITVVDPNQNFAIANADVVLVRAGYGRFDVSATGPSGSVTFNELPVGTYSASAYSKALGKSSDNVSFTVTRDGTAEARLRLVFSGSVDGTIIDPEKSNAPVPGSHVRLTASGYVTQSTSDVNGAFVFEGVREGTFTLTAKDTLTNRRVEPQTRDLTVLDPHRTVTLQLEPTESLHFAMYLPDDEGKNSGVLAPPLRVEAVQRCYVEPFTHVRHCDYERQLQGNPLVFPSMFRNSEYGVGIFQPEDLKPSQGTGGEFPVGTAANPLKYVFPAFGSVQVNVTQAGVPAVGAKIDVSGGNKGATAYTDSSGVVVFHGIRLGDVSANAVSLDQKFTGTARAVLSRQSVPAVMNIALGTYVAVSGYVEAEAGGPSVGTRVFAHYGSQSAELRTDSIGRYTIAGIPAPGSGSSSVSLTFTGPDDTTVGASTSVTLTAGGPVLVEAPSVKLDATAPLIDSILPQDGARDVSPDAPVVITFSEAMNTSRINPVTLKILGADSNGAVQCAISWKTLPDGRFAVTLTPAKPATGFPLASNTVYRVIVDGSLTDLGGHRLPATRGFTFTTTDYAEPRVQKVLPLNPIPKATTFEFIFNEQIDPRPWETGGNGEFHIYKLKSPGGPAAAIESELVAQAFVNTATIASLFIRPVEANPIVAESFYRVVFKGVRDPQGNTLAQQTYHFESFDDTAPHVVFAAPAASEELVSGSEYEVRLDLRNGSASGSPATDVKLVRYYTFDANDQPKQFALVQQSPFSIRILGPEAPAGGASYTIGAQATDGSGNEGPLTRITWTVRSNAAPTNVVVTKQQPSAYASQSIGATVTFDDEGTFATVRLNVSIPRTDAPDLTASMTKDVTRTAGAAWPSASFTYTLPANAKPGAVVTLSAVVTDVRGLAAAPATETIAIDADANAPTILSVTPTAGSIYFNNDPYTIEALVSDAESGVQSVTFTVDGEVFAVDTVTNGTTPGTKKYKSVRINAKAKAEDANIAIVVAAKDYSGNVRTKAFDVVYRGVNDPEAPKVAWICPTDRGAIPALDTNFPLSLRVNVVDQDVRSVKFLIGSTITVNAALKAGSTTEYVATHTFVQTPAPGPLTITAVVEDTVAAHTVELPITIETVTVDFKYLDAKAITAEDAALFNGKTIALIGPAAVLAPQAPLQLANLLVLNGAKIITLPATITREFRVDITTTGITYVDCDSSVDVTEKGYAAGWQNTSDGQNQNSSGRTVGNTATGGAETSASATHAGLGGRAEGQKTNAPYGSIVAPVELGAGGGGSPTCCTAGKPGGGAIALRGSSGADDASRVVIGGKLLAEGGGATGNFWAAGAGGSVWLDAKQVLLGSAAQVSANGGDDSGNPTGESAGGGGRIAIAASVKLDTSTAMIEARGGRNATTDNLRTAIDAGAGTIYLRKPSQTAGELLVSAHDSRFATTAHLTRPTPVGRIGSGTSTAIAANALTDATRTFDQWMIGEELMLGSDTTHRFTVTGISADRRTLLTDPVDGNLLTFAQSQTVAYAGLLVFDKVTAQKRATLVFDDSVEVGGVLDDKSVMTVDSTSAVLLRTEQASIALTSIPAPDATLVRDTNLSVTYSVTAATGVRSVTLTFPGLAPVTDTYTDYPATTPSKTITLAIPATQPLGANALTIRVIDRSGRTYDLPARTYNVTDNNAPTVASFSIEPASLAIYAGHDVVSTVVANDDVAVKSIAFDAILGGTSIKSQSFPTSTPPVTQQFTVPVPNTAPNASTLVISAAVSDGFAGRTPVVVSQTVTILPDTTAPQLTITSPTAGSSYRESADKVQVRITAIDAEVAVKEAFAQFDGGAPVALARVGTGDGWSVDMLAPPVDGEANVTRTVTITVRDYAGNERVSAPISIVVRPVIDANAPVLKWLCASSGAMYPPGHTVQIRVSATRANANNNVQGIEFLTEDGPLTATTVTVINSETSEYATTLQIPATATEGTTYRIRAIGRSAGGASSDLLTTFTVAVPTVAAITANTTIDTTTTTFDNQTVVITGGTVTIKGPHTFDRLMVLGGSVVAPSLETLQVTTTRGLYVGCGGSVSMNGAGYGPGQSYPGVAAAAGTSGGSHMGIGPTSNTDGPAGETYGSVYRPLEMGGRSGGDGGSGGGVVQLTTGSLVVDGSISANGTKRSSRAGAGGSVSINTTSISGGGTIQANGASADNGWGSGGGGAIGVRYAAVTSGGVLPVMKATSANAHPWGGAGTIYTSGPEATYGDLRIDDGGLTGADTRLPSLGSGKAQAGTSGAVVVTNRTAAIPLFFKGHWVEIRNAAGALEGTWRISAVNDRTFTLEGDNIDVSAGDEWQGVYWFDNVSTGSLTLQSADPIRVAGTHTVVGASEVESITTKNLQVISGGSITHPVGRSLTLAVSGELRVETGGKIDVNGRGCSANQSYPGIAGTTGTSGGSHIGVGPTSNTNGLSAETFGSIYDPSEKGGGGGGGGNGGGVVRITAASVVVNGSITANGLKSSSRAGAGGSISISTDSISGSGTLQANGASADNGWGGGGGGAVAVKYTDAASSVPITQAKGGSASPYGGAGSIYTFHPASTYGDLRIEDGGLTGEITRLPSLGSGKAQAGTSGALVVTNRTTDIPQFFKGHWVEIRDAAGTLKGTWRISSIDAKSFTLDGSNIAVTAGDGWQGVYRFDNIEVGSVTLESVDPIRAGTQTIKGAAELESITANDLRIVSGASVTHPRGSSLTLTLAGELRVETGGRIDVNGRGHTANQSYPGIAGTTGTSGGSHIGVGPTSNTNGLPAETFGSIYQPSEKGGGGGGGGNGGGVVRVAANSVVVNGSITANGVKSSSRAGAGGSIWISAKSVSGSGTLEASGSSADNGWGSGGGGAIAVEYTDAASTAVLPLMKTVTAGGSPYGGPGSIYTVHPQSTYGDLRIEDGGFTGGTTRLPALGSGKAQTGTSGAVVVTNRTTTIPQFFKRHWVEIRNAAGTLKGTWRISSIDGKSFTLEGSDVDVAAGDEWQGVYRFDNVAIGSITLESDDPIRAGTQTIKGAAELESVTASDLRIVSGGSMTHPHGRSLSIALTGELRIDTGAKIDVNGRGYAPNQSYPGVAGALGTSGGSHIGAGPTSNTNGAAAETFGSIYRPSEHGGGGGGGGTGGGVVRITATSVVVNGNITATGVRSSSRAAAGGSIWISTGSISGSGMLDASGSGADNGWGSAGGGAIAVEYTDAASAAALPIMKATSGANTPVGGAGSIYTFGPSSTYGSVKFDNSTFSMSNAESTILPSLGAGTVIEVSGNVISTSRTSIQPYFAGHWLDVFAPNGTRKGTWRISKVEGATLTLAGSPTVAAGDTWRGVYLFDTIVMRNAKVVTVDDLRGTIDSTSGNPFINTAPVVEPANISVESAGAGDFVKGTAGAVTDQHTPIVLTITNVRTAQTFTGNPAADGSFRIAVVGLVGDTFTIRAKDSYMAPATSADIAVNGALSSVNGVTTVSLQPASVTGGQKVLGTVRMRYAVVKAGDGVVLLQSSSSNASVPASVTVPVGASSATFEISTSSVSADTPVIISASSNGSTQSATLTLMSGSSSLTQLTLDAPAVNGGTSLNGTLVLGAPAPVGGASVLVSSSDTRLASVPAVVLVPEGISVTQFTITTYPVHAAGSVTISATYGAAISATATINNCVTMSGVVAPPPALTLAKTFFEDTIPAGATQSGDGAIDTTQFASGSMAIHLSGTAAGTRTFAFANATTALSVAPTDKLTFHLLVNPCDPPKELMIGWKTATTEYRSVWGESRLEVSTAHTFVGSLPASGTWVRVEVLAKTLGITSAANITGLTIRAVDGEAWVDTIGTNACSLARAAAPELNPNEIVWFDDAVPPGAVLSTGTSQDNNHWKWESTQAASGTYSHVALNYDQSHQHFFTGAEPIRPGQGDVLYAYVLIDPCNPPREVMLQWHGGSNNDWEHRAYWSEDMFRTLADRVGPMPEAGKWVRLEVPAAAVGLENQLIDGMAFTLYGGQAWFDRPGRIPRTNVALGKSAKQSTSDNTKPAEAAASAVDGSLTNYQATQSGAQSSWEVDLGASYPIETITITNRTDAFQSRLSDFWVLVSDQPFTSTALNTAKAQAGVSAMRHASTAGARRDFTVNRTGRYVRIQLEGTNILNMAEVQVWAPVSASRVNLAIGSGASQSSTLNALYAAVHGVDGLVNSNYSHTSQELKPYWQTDLGRVEPISSVTIYNRADCCESRLSKFYVLVSDTPMTSPDLATTLAQSGVSAFYYASPKQALDVPVNRTGRHVRVQLSGTSSDYLNLNEVQVWGQRPVLMPMLRREDPPPAR